MPPQLKEQRIQIVLVGDFNPHIFQPQWFVLQKLLGSKEGDSAKIELVHPDITIFNLDWLRLEVTRDRLVARSHYDQYYETLKDLIIGTFSILSHTPIKMLGINHTFVFEASDEASWHKIGDKFAPKDIWRKVMKSPGLRSLTIVSETSEKENYKNIVRVTVGPTNVKLSLRIHINDHFELTKIEDNALGSDAIMNIMKEEWDNSQKKAVDIKDKILLELA